MRGKCLDDSVLQSYMDGELTPELMGETAQHLADCTACASALTEAEGEFAFFGAAFAPDAALPVPTERLRDSLDAALAGRRAQLGRGSAWNFGALAAWLAAPFNVAPRHAAAFASLVAVVAFAALFGMLYLRRDNAPSVAVSGPADKRGAEVAAPPSTPSTEPTQEIQNPVGVVASGSNANGAITPSKSKAGSVVKASGRHDAVRAPKTPAENVSPAADPSQMAVPGEEKYLRAIASLSKVVELGGDAALKPAFRAEYARNLAVIDRAISETRRQALRNPQDADTTGFLFSAYQNKIDLLSTVADQAQVAALGR